MELHLLTIDFTVIFQKFSLVVVVVHLGTVGVAGQTLSLRSSTNIFSPKC